MSTEQKVVLLTLVDGTSFARRDFKNALNVPVVVKKGETIAVTEDVADQLLGEEHVRYDSDNEPHDKFKVAAEGTKVDHDFVTKAEQKDIPVREAPTIKHDVSVLPKTEQLADAVRTSKAARSQRAPRTTK